MEDRFNYLDYLKNNKLLKEDKKPLNEDFNSKLKETITDVLREKKAKKDDKPKPKKVDAPDDEEIDLEADVDLDTEFPDDGGGDEGEIDLGDGGEDTGGEDGGGLSGSELSIQKNLKIAYDSALESGDKKLAKQIGNTITMFTRTHVVGGDTGGMMETEDDNVPFEELSEGGEIMDKQKWATLDPDEKLDILLEFVKDVDEAFDYMNRDFDELPPQVLANITR